jgi:transposase InsO family protein
MAYSKNPYLPKVRLQAVKMVLSGKGVRQTARYFGVTPGAVSKWMKRAPKDFRGNPHIPTRSSRPHHHPHSASDEIKERIIELRKKTKRCSEVIHKHLENEGVKTSLSTVKRVLGRTGLVKKKSKWKKYHQPVSRPEARKPGDLVELDTIHMMYPGSKERIYIYTLLDVFSRWAYAWATPKIGAGMSVEFMEKALLHLPFSLKCLQSDHGPEFSSHFTRTMEYKGLVHRHSRVRTPNDNAHLERFNRTLQEECLYYLSHSAKLYNEALEKYLPHYNAERLHLGIDLKTPLEIIKCFQAID